MKGKSIAMPETTDLYNDAIVERVNLHLCVIFMMLLITARGTQQKCHATPANWQVGCFSDQAAPGLMNHASHTEGLVLAVEGVIEKASFATACDIGVAKVKARVACYNSIPLVVVDL